MLVLMTTSASARPRYTSSGSWEYQVHTTGTLTLAGGVVLDLARLYDELPA